MTIVFNTNKRVAHTIRMTVAYNDGDSSRCARGESDKPRPKIWEGVRNRIHSKTRIPVITRHPSKRLPLLKKSSEDMSQVALITAEETSLQSTESSPCNMVMLEAGLSGDTWRYCVERERLAVRSEWFRAMLVGPLAPAPSDPPPLLKLQHVDKRAFDYMLSFYCDNLNLKTGEYRKHSAEEVKPKASKLYLHNEAINFQSVSTARATLDAAHQYLCPELARLAVEYLERNLTSSTVLEIYQGLSLYATHGIPGAYRSSNLPSAPPTPGDDVGEIAAVCTRLFLACLDVIDSEPETVFNQERFEELSAVEVEELACRDTLRLINESVLFYALDRWAASDCRSRGDALSPINKRNALSNEVWYSVRYLLMTDREFREGPNASGILSNEECAFILAKINSQMHNEADDQLRTAIVGPLSRLSSTPRISASSYEERSCRMTKPGKKERQDNRKNRRKECASHGQRTCARIGHCLVRVLACVFD